MTEIWYDRILLYLLCLRRSPIDMLVVTGIESGAGSLLKQCLTLYKLDRMTLWPAVGLEASSIFVSLGEIQ